MESRSQAASAVSAASDHAPAVCCNWERCTRHWPLAAERQQVRLPVAPRAEGFGPLRGASEVEQGHALEDDGAVHDPGREWADLAGRDRHHHLVQPGDAPLDVAHGDERLALAEHPEGAQIFVLGSRTEFDGAARQVAGCRRIVSQHAQQARDQQEARGGALLWCGFVHERAGPAQPAPRFGVLAAQQEGKAVPERAPRRSAPISALERGPRGVLPRLIGRRVLTNQMCGCRPPLEVDCSELALRQRDGVRIAGPAPLLIGEGRPRLVKC